MISTRLKHFPRPIRAEKDYSVVHIKNEEAEIKKRKDVTQIDENITMVLPICGN